MYQDIDIIVSTTLPTIDKLMEYKNGGDALFLYFRYIRQARLQKTNITLSNGSFMAKGMGWSNNKFYKVKKILVDNSLIETVIRLDDEGKITGHYVKVNFIISPTISKNHTLEKPHTGKGETNAGSNIKENALNNKNKYKDKSFSKSEAIEYIYKSYYDLYPKEKRKHAKSAQAKMYIEQLLKEYDMKDLVESAINYYKATENSMYIIAPQYFYGNSKTGKQYRYFVDYIGEVEAPVKRVSVDFNKLI